MAQHGAMEVDRQSDAEPTTATTTATTTANGSNSDGANPALLLNMMSCVDTSLFSSQQLANWEQMKARIKAAADQNLPLVLPPRIADLVKHADANNSASATTTNSTSTSTSTTTTTIADTIDLRAPLHREASIQDVLLCLLDQQAPSLRMMASSGSNVLVTSELKNRGEDAPRPTLKGLLSSNDFTMTEKKQSLNHLLSFIDTSFASHPEPMTDVYKESQEGNLRRLSSLHLMRSFLSSGNPPGPSMGRTTSFEIIQSMLNATSNQTIQKPMTSQDSFRFQHLANVLESIEGDVGDDNEDYGGEEVVQVDNLDNLLDYQSPTHSSTPHQATTTATTTTTSGFVNTQTIANRAMGTAGNGAAFGTEYAMAAGGYQAYPPQMYHQYAPPPDLSMMYGGGGGIAVKEEPGTATHHHHHHQHQQPHAMLQQELLQQQMAYNPMSFQSAMMAATPGLMLSDSNAAAAYHTTQSTPMMKASALQHQHFNAILMQQQQQQHHHQQQQQQQQAPLRQSAKGHHKQDATSGVQICSALGCNHAARVKGMCKLHGSGRRCKVEGCMKSAQTGHLCIAHGGGKPCHVEGCPKTAQSRGLCKQHGGGVRCKFEGCTKSCQSGGYCRGHGGGKRCEYPNCTKWAQKNGHCAKHAQEVNQHIP